jgi:ligand-binding sensor domain-containing protein
MKQNILTFSLIALVIIGLIILGYFFIKPNHTGIEENPYSMKMDSLGEIPKDKFCATNYSYIQLQGTKSEAIAVDKNNNIYVSSDKKIICFDENKKLISEINCDYLATALAFSGDKLIAAFTNEISIYNTDGKELINWKMQNAKSYITSLAAIDGKIYVADAQAAKVYCFSEEGKLLKTIGQTADKKELTFFVLPSYYFDVAIDTDKSIWIANTGRHKLVQLDNDEHIISSWGETSSAVEGFCGCCNPSNFALMPDGSFITAEKGLVRVKKHSKNGEFECVIAGPEKFKEDAKGLDIAIDSNNKIYVLEPEAIKIHVFDIQNTRK